MHFLAGSEYNSFFDSILVNKRPRVVNIIDHRSYVCYECRQQGIGEGVVFECDNGKSRDKVYLHSGCYEKVMDSRGFEPWQGIEEVAA